MKTEAMKAALAYARTHIDHELWEEARAELAALEADNAAKDAALRDGIAINDDNDLGSLGNRLDVWAQKAKAALTPDSGKAQP